MISPARRHYQKATAAVAAAVANADAPQTSDEYQLMMASLIEDRRRLHDIQSIERKIEAKRTMLPMYAPYIEGVLQAGVGAQDDVLMTVLVWYLDVGDIDSALPIAEYAIKHALNPTEQYRRTTAAILAEESADTMLRAGIKPIWKDGGLKNEEDSINKQRLSQLQSIFSLTESHDMHDQIRAKLLKAIGWLSVLERRYPDALMVLSRALELDKNVGVKKDIELLQRIVGAA